jgi:hypothetical protein
MDMERASVRKEKLFRPIHQQIMMTDDQNDLLLLATSMCTTSIRIFTKQYGKETTLELVKQIIANNP